MRLTTVISTLALALPSMAALTATSCNTTCTLIGYENGLSVKVSVPPAPAVYRVEVAADGDTLSLSYEVVTNDFPKCAGDCRIEGDHIVISFGYMGWDQQHLVTLVTQRDGATGPREATVHVYRRDALVAEGTFKPRYMTDEPNGPGCGEHHFATASLDVP